MLQKLNLLGGKLFHYHHKHTSATKEDERGEEEGRGGKDFILDLCHRHTDCKTKMFPKFFQNTSFDEDFMVLREEEKSNKSHESKIETMHNKIHV